MALNYSPEEAEMYLIDFKQGVEFRAYSANGLPHARVIAIESEREFGLSVLQAQNEFSRDHALADLVKSSSGFRNLSGGFATTDANGYPTQDFVVPLWAGTSVDVGRYTVSFTGAPSAAVSVSRSAPPTASPPTTSTSRPARPRSALSSPTPAARSRTCTSFSPATRPGRSGRRSSSSSSSRSRPTRSA